MDIHQSISHFFEDLLRDLECHQDTRSYIVSVFHKFKNSQFDLSKDNITFLYSQAHHKQDFLTYQTVGDWILFSNSIAPNHLRFASKEYYDTIARLSYYSCYRLINKQWKLFEELSDNFSFLETQVKHKLEHLFFQSQSQSPIFLGNL